MSLRRYYHRHFGHHERFHLAVIFTIVVVAYVVVPIAVRYIEALQGYSPHFYEPKDLERQEWLRRTGDRKSTRLNSSHITISYAVFCLKKKKQTDLLLLFPVY